MFKTKSFQRNLFVSVGGLFILFAVCFAFYQYTREKEYKIDIMHSRLQTYNYEMMQTLGDSIVSPSIVRAYVTTHNLEGLRITVIDAKGKVIADSQQDDVSHMKNHLQRAEVQEALRDGNGYDIKRASETTNETYFYSATLFQDNTKSGQNLKQNGIIIRSAVPYSAALTKSLEADHTYIYFSVILTVLLGIVLYSNTKRITRHIGYLRQFTLKAEQGEELDTELEKKLPDDELGDISHNVISLYWKLRHSEEDKVRIKRQLTQNAAHELKTPAASIQGYLETIINTPNLDEEKRKHFLERCYTQSDRMCRLLQDMSTLTKLDDIADSGSEKNKIIEVDVKAVIDNVLDDTALQLQSKHILPTLNLPDEVKVLGDTSLIYSIFRNLIDNTLAYATGATKISILCLECDDDDKNGKGYYEFTVSDNGCGVDPEHLDHLFERFYRVDKGRSRKLGGTGLGLAIVKNSVSAHGGSTIAELTPGGGLTIRFTLTK